MILSPDSPGTAHEFAQSLSLSEIATAVSLQRTYALEIEAAKPGERRDELAKYWRAQAATCAMLARQLRLTPRSRVDKRIGRPRTGAPATVAQSLGAF